MSEDESVSTMLRIEPEPTIEELIAIVRSLRPAVDDVPVSPPRSRWIESGRREQLHNPLFDRRGGWNS